jgi:predicted Zn-dependent protease
MDLTSPENFFLFFATLWILVCLLIARVGGWTALAQFYSLKTPFSGRRWYLQTAGMRWHMSYNHCLTLGANDKGLYMAVLFLFRFGHPPLFIPWPDISITEKHSWMFEGIEMRFRQAPFVPLVLRTQLAERLAAAAGSAWPSRPSLPVGGANESQYQLPEKSKPTLKPFFRFVSQLLQRHLFLSIVSLVIVLTLGSFWNIRCLLQPEHVPLNIKQLTGSGQVYFVPFDGFPRTSLEALAQYYREKYGLTIVVGDNLASSPSAFNATRKQFIAEALIALLHSRYQSQRGEKVIPIGFTNRDIYVERYNWNYAFGYREDSSAVVSSARMDYGFLGIWPVSPEKEDSRLRKMVTRNIGVLYYRLPLSDHCRSVLFQNVGGPQELDFMGEDF